MQMHAEEEASQYQHGEGQMQKGPAPVTGLARMRYILAGHLQMPDLDTPLSDPPNMFLPEDDLPTPCPSSSPLPPLSHLGRASGS